jgi:hypothetical protein
VGDGRDIVAIARFDEKANRPARWLNRAESLLLSAEILSRHSICFREGTPAEELKALHKHSTDFRVFPVILMLRAMALECLFKCLWLCGGNKMTADGSYAGIRGIRNHDLVGLARAVGTTLVHTELEIDMLERLSLFISRGRYPHQTKWETSKKRTTKDRGLGNAQNWAVPR